MIGNLPARIKEEENRLMVLSEKVSLSHPLENYHQVLIKQSKNHLEFLYECENSFWEQRAKVKWNTQDERNTIYFHAIVSKRHSKNLIRCLQREDGSWESDQKLLQIQAS